jgi:outer membrane lipoprotein SlyB
MYCLIREYFSIINLIITFLQSHKIVERPHNKGDSVMMKTMIFILTLMIAMLCSTAMAETAGTTTSIQYGVVQSAQTISKDSRHAGGALVGGLVGALVGGRRHRTFKVVAGAATGAAIQGASSGGDTLQQYMVKTLDGGEIRISTEQQDIRTGDCVVIEQGEHANIRRVSSVHCAPPVTTIAPQHHQQAANECQSAKKELVAAKTEEAVNLASQKVRVLCED